MIKVLFYHRRGKNIGLSRWPSGKEFAYSCRRCRFDPCIRVGKIPGGENGNHLQYSYPENPMDGGAWWATVQGVRKSGHDMTMTGT